MLAVTLKTKMPRLDYSRMHGSYRDLVNFFSSHCEEIGHTRNGRLQQTSARPVWSLKSNRLQPGVAFRTNLPLLGDFTLEPMSLGTFKRQARI